MFWKPIPQVEVLKVGVLDFGSKPFTPQGRAGSWELPFNCMALGQGWVLWQKCIATYPIHFDVGLFSFTQCVRVTQLVPGFVSEATAPCVTVDSVCQCV